MEGVQRPHLRRMTRQHLAAPGVGPAFQAQRQPFTQPGRGMPAAQPINKCMGIFVTQNFLCRLPVSRDPSHRQVDLPVEQASRPPWAQSCILKLPVRMQNHYKGLDREIREGSSDLVVHYLQTIRELMHPATIRGAIKPYRKMRTVQTIKPRLR